ncbi:hypothetical protein ARSEF4850_009855 [Beauveria asiatica]
MSADSMGHLGILREENIALRQMMGYNTDALEAPPYKVPQIGQFIPGTSIEDVLVVAIDIDNPRCRLPLQDQSYHIGLSILDTRCLASRIDDVSKTIISYQFTNDNSKSCWTAKKRFLFGETETMLLANLAPRLAELVKGRDYVLVGHGINEDIKFMNQLHPDIAENAAYLFDTVKVAQFPLKLYYRYSLEKLLDELGIKYANLHAAGNDAHFALKALLVVAVRDGLSEQHRETSGHREELFLALEIIAHAPVQLPVWTDEPPPPKVPDQRKKKMGVKAKGRLKRERRAIRRAFQNLPFAYTTMASSDEEGPDHSLQGNFKSAAVRSWGEDESTVEI